MCPRELPVIGGGTPLPHMTLPVLLAFHEQPALARAIETHLRREFGPRGYEAMCVDSSEAARRLLETTSGRGEDVALVVVDGSVGGTDGLELVGEARRLHATVRSVLLVDPDGIAAAVEATADGSLDYFLVKPLVSPDEQLVPVVADLLDDWQRWIEAGAGAVRVVDRRTPAARAVLRFLDGNDVRRQFLDLDSDSGARLLLAAATDDSL